MKNAARHNRKGFVLILSLLTSSVILVLTIPYISRVVADYKFTAKIYNTTAALDLAEAGIESALWEICWNSSAFKEWTPTADGHEISVNSFQTSTGQSMGDYDVSVSISPDGMAATVEATGYVPNRTLSDGKRTVRVKYEKRNFSKAVAALDGITMSGQAKTDSYDSGEGTYNVLLPDGSHNIGQNGDIATNGSISLGSNTYVNGDANPGEGHPFSGTPPVSGSYGTLQAPLVIDPIPVSTLSAAQASNNNGNILLNGEPWTGGNNLSASTGTVTIPGGTYYFTSISISGQANITITGTGENPTIIYVDGGGVSISGQGILNNGQPRNLLLYSSGFSISLSGQAEFAGAIYAPSAVVTLSGLADVYGSIICGSNIYSGQAAIHFDMDLLTVSPVFTKPRVTSWQETQQ